MPEKKKFYLSIGLFLLALLICYKLAFQSTINTIANYRLQIEKSQVANEMPRKAALLKKQLNSFDTRYFNSMKGIDQAHEVILEHISSLALTNKVTVTGYPALHSSQRGTLLTETHMVELQGRFSNIVKVIYQMETTPFVGRIASVEYFTETDRATKGQLLFARIYIQNFKNHSNYDKN